MFKVDFNDLSELSVNNVKHKTEEYEEWLIKVCGPKFSEWRFIYYGYHRYPKAVLIYREEDVIAFKLKFGYL